MTGEAVSQPRYARLGLGDPAPWFRQRSTSNEDFAFDTVAGRYVVLGFLASMTDASAQAAMTALAQNRRLFDDDKISFFGVTIDPGDEAEKRVREVLPGIRFFFDFDRRVSQAFGATPAGETGPGPVQARQFWMVLDPMLRVLGSYPMSAAGNSALFDHLAALPGCDLHAGVETTAPVLLLPNIFEPAFCNRLIELYETHGGRESGFMRDVDGKTVELHDHSRKRRRDHTVEDGEIIRLIQQRILRRVNPQIEKAYCYKATRMERYIVSCYDAAEGGHFRAHRDNTTRGTAHRRFAVSINLNGDFEGGELIFPEFGSRRYRAPPGGAVVFAGALMHQVMPVTGGRRYAFLPFIYDEEAARIREANARYLEGEAAAYRA